MVVNQVKSAGWVAVRRGAGGSGAGEVDGKKGEAGAEKSACVKGLRSTWRVEWPALVSGFAGQVGAVAR